MNVPAKVDHDPETGELMELPDGFSSMGNQSLAVSLARAEVDQQIHTARALPRNVRRAVDNILSLATLDDQSAEECVYALPRGGKPIKGPSVRLAEIISSQWGNCRVGARVVHVDRIEKYVEAEGVFHDLETNAATTARVRRRISDSKGRLYNDDMIVVTGNAACSIAKRNAILGAVPKAVWRKAYEAVESVIAGDAKTLVERRDKAMKAFAAFGLTPERVCTAIGVDGIDDIKLEHLPLLIGAHSALKSGEGTVDELFPAAGANAEQEESPKTLKGRLDDLVSKKQSSASTPSHGDTDRGAENTESSKAQGDSVKGSGGKSPPPSDPVDPVEEARAEGAANRAKGMARKAVPQKYRKDDGLLEAYLSGFDEGGDG